jgi:hypothetical protein
VPICAEHCCRIGLPSEDTVVSTYIRKFTFTVTTNVFLLTFPPSTQAIAFLSQSELNNNGTKVSYKQDRSPQDETQTKTKHSTGSEYWLNQPFTSSCFTVILDAGSEDKGHKTSPENIPQAVSNHVTGIKNVTSFISQSK